MPTSCPNRVCCRDEVSQRVPSGAWTMPAIMKRLVYALCCAVLFALSNANAASTINATNHYAWGANIGWTNWLPSTVDGVVIGEYVCSGYVYGANVGWITLGNGNPANHIQYQNNSATDFGVNYSLDPAQPGVATLRGFG